MTDHDTAPTGPFAPDDIDETSPVTLPGFFEALDDGRLLAGRCTVCGTHLVPPRPACHECGSRAVTVEEQPRTGEVVTYTAVERPPSPFADLAPFTVAIVELDSGARLTGRLTEPYEAVDIGMAVEWTVSDPVADGVDPAAFLPYEADWPIPVFEPR